eukprot:scaffold9717_cov183-Skeletonema_dohrnii-CCMP3373.AAC.2
MAFKRISAIEAGRSNSEATVGYVGIHLLREKVHIHIHIPWCGELRNEHSAEENHQYWDRRDPPLDSYLLTRFSVRSSS